MSKFPLWLRVMVAALMALPLLVAVLAFVPALLISVFLPQERRNWLLEVLDRFVAWVEAIFSGDTEDDEGEDTDA